MELIPKDDFETSAERNEFWRGYEAAKAIQQVVKGGPKTMVFGKGYGALVDLEITISLGGGDFRYIPTIHNGIALVFFKTGFLGLFLYFMFLWRLIVCSSKVGGTETNSRYLRALGFALFVLSFSIGGLYNKSSVNGLLVIIAILISNPILIENAGKRLTQGLKDIQKR